MRARIASVMVLELSSLRDVEGERLVDVDERDGSLRLLPGYVEKDRRATSPPRPGRETER